MPKKQIDYQNTIIYKLVCKNLDIKDLYVGHTTNFKQRKSMHKHNCNNQNCNGYDYYVYTFIRDNGGWDNWDMIEVKKICCKDKYEALKQERYWYEELKGTLNCKIPSRTQKEYYENNKEYILEKNREYNKEYREKNKEEIKKYREKNKEEIKKYDKEYYEKNKEKIKEKLKIKVECPCGSFVNKGELSRHKKSKKHQEWEKKNE